MLIGDGHWLRIPVGKLRVHPHQLRHTLAHRWPTRWPDTSPRSALASAWYEAGPAQSCALFAGWFAAWHRRGVLRARDPELAAEHFNWLVLSIPLNRAMAHPLTGPPFTTEQLDRWADAGVDVFLAAYRTTP